MKITTYAQFTRPGPQCGICNAWRKPCEHCESAGVVIGPLAVLALLIGVTRLRRRPLMAAWRLAHLMGAYGA